MRAAIIALAIGGFALANPASAQAAGLALGNKMPVITSDGVQVAEVMHVPDGGRSFGPDETFFTADSTYMLRRIYGREASLSGGEVRLKMTAAQFRARRQNPD